jgi:hypothetical protein
MTVFSTSRRGALAAVLIFFLATVVMTWPVIRSPASAIVGDWGDSLLNSWIIAWDVHALSSGRISTLFDANIFYPRKNTLAYSENMLANALLAFPVYLLSGNPLLSYNFVFFMSLFLSALGAFLLARQVTGSPAAAVAAGMIYGFFPWRFSHLSHLQLQSAQWIPFALLFLHRLFSGGKKSDALLFALFFVLQFLACGYYGLFLILFVGVYVLLSLPGLFGQGRAGGRIAIRFAAAALLAGAVLSPVLSRYALLRSELGFRRSLGETIYFSADIVSYLATSERDLLWGRALKIFRKPEGDLFIGAVPVLLGLAGIFIALRRRPGGVKAPVRPGNFRRLAVAVAALLATAQLIALLAIMFTGGADSTVLGLPVSATSLDRPFLILLALLALLFALNGGFRRFFSGLCSGRPEFILPRFYLLVFLLSFLFSLGPLIHCNRMEMGEGLYALLYDHVPGFSGIRVPARFVITVALSLSVFAAYSLSAALRRLRDPGARFFLAEVVSLLILFESASVPISMSPMPTGEKIPPVYRWLKEQPGDFAILEIPLPAAPAKVHQAAAYMYYSTYHWKSLVNGYSGCFPPEYDRLYQTEMGDFPSPASLAAIKRLGVRYVIFHYGEYRMKPRKGIWKAFRNDPAFIPVGELGEAFVYELGAGK